MEIPWNTTTTDEPRNRIVGVVERRAAVRVRGARARVARVAVSGRGAVMACVSRRAID